MQYKVNPGLKDKGTCVSKHFTCYHVTGTVRTDTCLVSAKNTDALCLKLEKDHIILTHICEYGYIFCSGVVVGFSVVIASLHWNVNSQSLDYCPTL